MLNQVILVGEVLRIDWINDDLFTLTIDTNPKGFGCEVVIELSSTFAQWVKPGITVGVKARIGQKIIRFGNTEMRIATIIGEKVTVVTTKKDGD